MGGGAILIIPPPGFSFAPLFFVPSACKGSATGLWLGPFSTYIPSSTDVVVAPSRQARLLSLSSR